MKRFFVSFRICYVDERRRLFRRGSITLILVTMIGLGAIVWGSDFTVDGASYIAKSAGMSDRIIIHICGFEGT